MHKSLQVILFPVMSTHKRAWLIVTCCLLLFASEGQAQEDLPNPLEQIEPHWTSYVAIVTGIIGAITGIAGSIMGYIAYRRSNALKKSDRRLNLHQLRNAAHIAGADLLDLLPKALTSRKEMLNARGLFHSSIMREYTAKHEEDSKRAKELSKQIPKEDVNCDSMSLQQLEQEWVRLDRTKGQIDHLISEYRDSIKLDGKWQFGG